MIYQGIDTAARITPGMAKILRENGVSFAVRYLVPESGSTAWKALTAAEAADIRDAGLALMLVWETTAGRVKSGAAGGAEDAVKARKLAEDMGVPSGTVIYFAADYDVQESDLETVRAYYRAARVACGKYVIGVYGGERVCKAMADAGFSYLWQCVAWTNEFIPAAHVIQYEWQFGSDAQALTTKVGVAVDLDSASTLNGMWLPVQKDTEAEDAHKWCVSVGITDASMRDVRQTELMLWRYYRYCTPEDPKSESGIISD